MASARRWGSSGSPAGGSDRSHGMRGAYPRKYRHATMLPLARGFTHVRGSLTGCQLRSTRRPHLRNTEQLLAGDPVTAGRLQAGSLPPPQRIPRRRVGQAERDRDVPPRPPNPRRLVHPATPGCISRAWRFASAASGQHTAPHEHRGGRCSTAANILTSRPRGTGWWAPCWHLVLSSISHLRDVGGPGGRRREPHSPRVWWRGPRMVSFGSRPALVGRRGRDGMAVPPRPRRGGDVLTAKSKTPEPNLATLG